MAVLLISVGVVLILCVVVLFSAKDEKQVETKSVKAKKENAAPVPKAKNNVRIEDLVHFDGPTEPTIQHPTGSNALSFAKYLFVFIMIIAALLYAKKILPKDMFPSLRSRRMASAGLTEKEYQEICMQTLKPAMEQAIEFAPMSAFAGGSNPDKVLGTTLTNIAEQFDLPCANSIINLCAAAEQRYNPNAEDRIFKDKKKPTSLQLNGQP